MVIKIAKEWEISAVFSFIFFQLWKAKFESTKKVEDKWLFIPFPLSFQIHFIWKIWRFFIFRPPNAQKVWFSTKGLSNLMQTSIITITCWFWPIFYYKKTGDAQFGWKWLFPTKGGKIFFSRFLLFLQSVYNIFLIICI